MNARGGGTGAIDAAGSTAAPKPPLRSALASLIKELLWKIARFHPRRKPIALYASRRSGSSLLMEVIAVNAGVMFSDQPFSLYTASSSNLNRLPIFPYGQFACPDAVESRLIEDYLRNILEGRIRANVPWKLWSREYHFTNDRLCLKITDAKALADWIDQRFDVATIVSTRHPIAQALSVANLGWQTTGKGLLRNSGFLDRWLDSRQEAMCWDIYRGGNELQQRVADWSLENLPLLRLLPQRDHWCYLSYEELIGQTSKAVDYLSKALELPDVKSMERRVSRPSRSTRRESTRERKTLIQRQDKLGLLDSWRSAVSPEDLRAAFQILDRFEIDLYRPDSPFPERDRVGRTVLPKVDVTPGRSKQEDPVA